MQALIDALYWICLATWFGAVLFSAVAPPVTIRVIRGADPTLPRVLSVNLDHQHSTLLAGSVIAELLQLLFRIEAACAAAFLPVLVAKWFTVERSGPHLFVPLIVTALYVIGTAFLLYGWRVVWPKVMLHRDTYIDNADDVDKAKAELDLFDRYSGETASIVRNLLAIVLGMILFSAALVPHVAMTQIQ